MKILECGDPASPLVLIEPVYEDDINGLEHKAGLIRSFTGIDFHMLAFRVGNWNHDLSPWKAPAVFGTEEFGDGAVATLEEVLKLTEDRSKTYYLGGYSLAGLFALWAATQTDAFQGVAGVSPSVWFPGFADHVKMHPMRCDSVYLSLGDKEEKTRNPVMATVGARIRDLHIFLNEQGITNKLEWNPGNHFRDPDLRMARGFAWLMKCRQSINRFAAKWLERFNDPDVQYIELVDHWMADDCRALGFEMDCGEAFCKDYLVSFQDCDALSEVIDQITDISLLGSAIYSKWRYFNHWAYSGSEILEPKNRKWFVIMLERLKTLSEEGSEIN